jgi:DNA-damage-inducible protein J
MTDPHPMGQQMPDDMPETETETVIRVHVDERTRRAAEMTLHQLGLTLSQFFSLLLEGIAHDDDKGLAVNMVKYATMFGPQPIIPNAETVEAMEAARRGEMKEFATIEELFADLNSDADD